jgi:phage protein U
MWWGALGLVIFRAAASPRRFTDQQQWRVVEHPLIQQYPALDHMGPELRRVRLEIDLHRRFTLPFSPDWQTDVLRGYAERAQPQPLVQGTNYLGDYLITRLESEILASDMAGLTVLRRVQLDLVEARGAGLLARALGQATDLLGAWL